METSPCPVQCASSIEIHRLVIPFLSTFNSIKNHRIIKRDTIKPRQIPSPTKLESPIFSIPNPDLKRPRCRTPRAQSVRARSHKNVCKSPTMMAGPTLQREAMHGAQCAGRRARGKRPARIARARQRQQKISSPVLY